MGRKKVVVFAALAAFIFAITLIYSRQAQADNKRWGANYFPNVPLVDQDGKTVHFYDDLIKGKSVVLDMIYTHCVDSCPLETARLVQVQKMLGDRVGKDIFFYSITIDPKRDTPKVLKQYAENYHVGPGWNFYTGKPEDITLIAKKLGLYSDPDPNNRDGHTPGVLIGNEPTGQWMVDAATDNPRFMSIMIGDWLNSWKNHKNGPLPSYANATAVQKDGRYLFARHCAACHTIGHGDKIGPDLIGVANVRDSNWLARQIATPDELIAAKDPIATALFKKYKQVRMPNLRLDQDEVQLIIDFMKNPEAPQPQSIDASKAKALDLTGAHGH
ncbi:MAG TPA: SCO family protein [Candidatus Angelobacter sp.]|jgi:protein SCO1|nr:SCO family protein [Candidatus Angelobacter sp.]